MKKVHYFMSPNRGLLKKGNLNPKIVDSERSSDLLN